MDTDILLDHEPPAAAPTAQGGGDREPWTVVFVLGADLSPSEREKVLDRLESAATFVDQPGYPLTLSVGSAGPMDEALADAVAEVKDALGVVAPVQEVRMVSHQSLLSDPSPGKMRFYGVTECARALGVSHQRASQLLAESKLPEPDAALGDKVLWEASRFERFARHRRDAVKRTRLGLGPESV